MEAPRIRAEAGPSEGSGGEDPLLRTTLKPLASRRSRADPRLASTTCPTSSWQPIALTEALPNARRVMMASSGTPRSAGQPQVFRERLLSFCRRLERRETVAGEDFETAKQSNAFTARPLLTAREPRGADQFRPTRHRGRPSRVAGLVAARGLAQLLGFGQRRPAF